MCCSRTNPFPVPPSAKGKMIHGINQEERRWVGTHGRSRKEGGGGKGREKRREEKSESGSGRGNEVCGGGRESRDVILIIYRDNKQPDFSSAKSSELRGRYRVSGLARAGFTEGCLLAWRLASGGVFIVDESWSSCRSPLGWGRGKENKNFFSKTSFPSRLLLIHCWCWFCKICYFRV